MTIEKLIEIISECTGIDITEITQETLFVEDLGLDSLELLKIITRLEEIIDFEIPFDKATNINSVGELFDYLIKR